MSQPIPTTTAPSLPNSISVGGKRYPTYHVLGAYRLFESLTGTRVTQMQPDDVSALTTFIYCLALKACKRDGISFPYDSPDDFADDLTLDDLNAWQQAQTLTDEADAPRAKKKK